MREIPIFVYFIANQQKGSQADLFCFNAAITSFSNVLSYRLWLGVQASMACKIKNQNADGVSFLLPIFK
ncbi:hypothetical protein XCR1_1520008 [Xenorhabdus cabanillasii JM26]|uniref:Uncharacterized protein n=1 Tax=Xenorhabdus cabanillasii JM26 TaxID=1427517 RepID=W1ITA4_9GAMM|nr:hypothetical protein XCR1_1520008 [Xenorhabdus cabanillasii JM26]